MAELRITIVLVGETAGSPEIWPESIPVREMLARLVLDARSDLAGGESLSHTWSLVLLRTGEPLRLEGTLRAAGVVSGDTVALHRRPPEEPAPAQPSPHPASEGGARHSRLPLAPMASIAPAAAPGAGPARRPSIFKMTTAELMDYLRSVVRSKPGPPGRL
ncbi:MAG: hypothetical protein HY815_22560 [Candidatus Riflebacteria bacterium]|nr:hypothetical protein [Candidatus Riflebacteria bacterium]